MLTTVFHDWFDATIRERGAQYFRSGCVQRIEHADGTYRAIVEGGDVYTVRIRPTRDGKEVHVDCTCPYFVDQSDACKHIWAVFLALNSVRAFPTISARAVLCRLDAPPAPAHGLRIVDVPDPDIDDLSEAIDGDVLDALTTRRQIAEAARARWAQYRAARSATRAEPPRPEQTPSHSTTWTTLIRQLAEHTAERSHVNRSRGSVEAGAIEPVYVVDLKRSLETERLVVSVMRRVRRKNGTPGKLKKLELSAADIPRLADPRDREFCLMLVGATSEADSGPYYGYSAYRYATSRPGASVWGLPPQALDAMLPLLFATGRVLLRRDAGDPAGPTPLTWESGDPWELVGRVVPSARSRAYGVEMALVRGDQRRALGPTDHIIGGETGLLIAGATLSRVRANDADVWLAYRERLPEIQLRAGDRPAFVDRLARFPRAPRFEWPAEWSIREVRGLQPAPSLSLESPDKRPHWRRDRTIAVPSFQYDGTALPPEHAGRWFIDPRGSRQIERDLDAERRLIARLTELGAARDRYEPDRFEIPNRRLGDLIAALLAENWTVTGADKLYRRATDWSLKLSTGIDWFDLNGRMSFGDQHADLPALLAAAKSGEKMVKLGDGTFGVLPEDWLRKHGAFLHMGAEHDGALRFAQTQIGLLDLLLAELPEVDFDRDFAAARERIRRFSHVAPLRPSEAFVGELRPYQKTGLGWLGFLDDIGWGGCLADDMGLGKTVQVLALLQRRRAAGVAVPSLAVVPKSIVFNWIREAERFTPDLRVANYTGGGRKVLRDELSNHDLIVTTYGILRRDIAFLKDARLDYVVLDEAQAIKNAGSQNAKACRLLRGARRLAMTGTPVENRLDDLWSLMDFLNPGMLGSMPCFRAAFARDGGEEESAARRDRLRRLLRPFILRRTKEQVAPELPPKTEQTIECEMAEKQAACYAELREYYRRSLLSRIDSHGLQRSKIHVLEALLRLRQAACHPGLIDSKKRADGSAKLETLLPMLVELAAEGHKALVFSQFTQMLAILRSALDRAGLTYEYLDGRTTDRAKRVDRFQQDAVCPLFLISLKAGGVGLNLTAADYVFILDPWWNPAVEAQAIDRTHRIGQEKKVIAYRLIARDTVESKILALQDSKRKLAEAIITEDNSLIQKLTREDLELLLS